MKNKKLPMNLNEVGYSVSDLFDLNVDSENFSCDELSIKDELLVALGNYCSLNSKNITLTLGADGAIDLCFQLFKGKAFYVPFPSYSGFHEIAKKRRINKNNYKETDLLWLLDTLDENSVILICHPENPSGKINNKILAHINESKAIIIVDEAYIECCPEESVLTSFKLSKNIFIVRTFSKAFAIPGLRLGYLVCDELWSKKILNMSLEFPVSNLSMYVGLQLLKKKDIIGFRLKKLTLICKSVMNEISKLQYNVSNSSTYFFSLTLKSVIEAEELYNYLLSKGILSGDFCYAAKVRLCVLDAVSNRKLIDALTKFKQCRSLVEM